MVSVGLTLQTHVFAIDGKVNRIDLLMVLSGARWRGRRFILCRKLPGARLIENLLNLRHTGIHEGCQWIAGGGLRAGWVRQAVGSARDASD
jgi:hypothetical protein